MRRRLMRALAAAFSVSLALVAAACGASSRTVPFRGGDADRGARLIRHFGCGGCHTIPGIEGADARVGPPLDDFPEHRYIAGEIPNTPHNAVRWIVDPKRIEPGTVMPDLGVTRAQARDIVAYLYSRT